MNAHRASSLKLGTKIRKLVSWYETVPRLTRGTVDRQCAAAASGVWTCPGCHKLPASELLSADCEYTATKFFFRSLWRRKHRGSSSKPVYCCIVSASLYLRSFLFLMLTTLTGFLCMHLFLCFCFFVITSASRLAHSAASPQPGVDTHQFRGQSSVARCALSYKVYVSNSEFR